MKTLQDFILLAKDDIERNIAAELDNQPVPKIRFSRSYAFRKKQIINQYRKKLFKASIRWAFVLIFIMILASLSFNYWNHYNIKLK